jgi:hypothetical protein
VWGVARRRSESGHGGGWRLRVATLTNGEAADRFVDSAPPRAAAPRSLTDLNQKPCKPGHVHRARSEVGTPGAGSPPSVPSWAHGGIRARSVRCCGVAGLRLAAGTSTGLRAGHELGGSLGPRAWGARRGRAVTCALGGVTCRTACGCAAATYGGLRPGDCCASKGA